ncbi:MAG TPA: YMGG-like glycine zipper-containing protein [Xanthobacteraceae bacterium]|nr:YMGG-like glycine zipper-containing protein [Xanthobacteraceae bacterium]
MNVLKFAAIAIVALGTTLAGCAQTPQEHRAATGAALGAAGGALLGQAIGRNTGSTLLGAGAGALLGAAVANSSAPQPAGPAMCRYRAPDGSIYVAECDERYYRGQY